MGITERKSEFKKRIWEAAGKNFETYSQEMLSEFFEYWTEHNEPVTLKTKMRFEKERTFQISRRLSTWKKMSETNFGRFKAKTTEFKSWPNYLNQSLLKRLDGDKWWQYVNHLRKLNYQYISSPTGSHFVTPDKKRIWI